MNRRPSTSQQRGFTLVELMVALTGGFLVAISVFTLARDSSRFYQNESRVASATFGSVLGFQRLRLDLGRAGFLSTPNILRDPKLCGSRTNYTATMNRLVSVRVDLGASPGSATLADNGISPDRLTLGGSFTGSDQFAIDTIEDVGAGYEVHLQPNTGALARAGYISAAAPDKKATLEAVFGRATDHRMVRIVDKAGRTHWSYVVDVHDAAEDTHGYPSVVIEKTPITPQFEVAGACNLHRIEEGGQINVVNLVRYDIRALTVSDARYGVLYDPVFNGGPGDANRTELVRTELRGDTGADITDTAEIVAEYAVDLRIGVSYVTAGANGSITSLLHSPFNAADVANYTTDTDANRGPQKLRAVRARLSVRARADDRTGNLIAPGPGIYRIGLGAGGIAPFARVRTLQTEVALRNQAGVAW